MRTRVQKISSVAAGLLGIGGLALGLLMPRYFAYECAPVSGTTSGEYLCHTSAENLYAELGSVALLMALVPACVFAVVAIAGLRNARSPARVTRRLLLAAAAALVVLTIMVVGTLGMFMLVGTLLAVYTALLARGEPQDETPTRAAAAASTS